MGVLGECVWLVVGRLETILLRIKKALTVQLTPWRQVRDIGKPTAMQEAFFSQLQACMLKSFMRTEGETPGSLSPHIYSLGWVTLLQTDNAKLNACQRDNKTLQDRAPGHTPSNVRRSHSNGRSLSRLLAHYIALKYLSIVVSVDFMYFKKILLWRFILTEVLLQTPQISAILSMHADMDSCT